MISFFTKIFTSLFGIRKAFQILPAIWAMISNYIVISFFKDTIIKTIKKLLKK